MTSYSSGCLRISHLPSLVGALLLLLHCCHASDADVLLDLLNRTTGWRPTNWAESNRNNLCIDWAGVTCDGNNRISALDLTVPKNSKLIGTMTPRLVELTEIVTFQTVDMYDIYGKFPSGFFSLPKLDVFSVEAAMDIEFPANIAPNLSYLNFRGANYSKPLPDFDWSSIEMTIIEIVGLQCPLPQSFINRLYASPQLNWYGYNTHVFDQTARKSYCSLVVFRQSSFVQTALWVKNNSVCGQVPLAEFKCDLWPLITEPPQYTNDVPPPGTPAVQFSVPYKNVIVEYSEDATASIFLTYTQNGQTKIFRDEYTQLKFFPIQESTGRKSLALSPFFNLDRRSANIVAMNATCYDPATGSALFAYQWIWEFGVERSNVDVGDVSIKFSIRIYNYNRTYESYPELGIVSSYRMKHSPVGGEPLQCSGNFLRTNCVSSIFQFSSAVNLDLSTGTTVSLSSARAQFKFSYSFLGTLDGINLLTPGYLDARGSAYYYGLGYDTTLKLAISSNQTALLQRPSENQWINFLIRFGFKPFKDLYYDPDVQMRLLFVADEPPKADGASSAQDVNSETIKIAAGVTASIVILAAVIFAMVFIIKRRSSMLLEQKRVNSALSGSNSGTGATKSTTTMLANPPSTSLEPEQRGWKTASVDHISVSNT